MNTDSHLKKKRIDQPTADSEYFTLPAHSIDNMYIELVPLELITSNRDAIRKAREAFLISTGKITIEPFGLNRRDEIWSIYFLFFFIYLFWYTF